MKTKEIAAFLSAELLGDPDIEITGIASLDSAGDGELAFSSKTDEFASSASAVIVPLNYERNSSAALIKAPNPKLAFILVANKLRPIMRPIGWDETAIIPEGEGVRASFIGPFVSIGTGTRVGDSSCIHAGVRIGSNVTIKKNTVIHPNCVVYDGVEIGDDCVIHAGTVIGSDGFGYVRDENGEHLQFPQAGSVVIGDKVEIGANCTIDRGSLGVTEIGDGTKLDNLVHIAHNVRIGRRVLIAGQSGIAGSSVIEDDVVLAGQVGISDHVIIRSGAIIGAKSSVFPHKIVREGFWMGIPVEPLREYRKRIIQSRRSQNRD